MAVKLHRCGTMWLKIGTHPCWRVQKALDEAGIDYEVVEHPKSRGTRTALAIRQVSLCVAASPDYLELTGGPARDRARRRHRDPRGVEGPRRSDPRGQATQPGRRVRLSPDHESALEADRLSD
jgi:DNA-binding transcriptional LysR family regulator